MTPNAVLPARLLVAVALISAAALGYELLLMRLMAVIQWHHFAGMIISLALLGYGVSGTVLALLRRHVERAAEALFIVNALLLAVAMPACFALAQAIPFNGLALVWETRQLSWLTGLYLSFAVPFLLAANCFGVLFCAWPRRIGRVYGADLAGAGAGAVGIVASLWVLRPENLLLALSAVVFLAVAIAAWARSRGLAGLCVGTALVLLLVAPREAPWLELNITQFKQLPQRLAVMGAHVREEHSSPYALLSVVDSPDVPFREAPGLSLNTRARVPEQTGVFIDAHALQTIDVRVDERSPGAQRAYLNDSLTALPYRLLDAPEVLVLDAGTGQGVRAALFHGASAVVAQELNPQLSDLASGLYAHEDVSLRDAAARQLLAAEGRHYDLITLHLGGGPAAAVHTDYRFTVEAVVQYLARLSVDGLLAVSVPVRYPPRDSLRVLSTLAAALGQSGAPDPGAQVFMLRNWDSALVLAAGRPFTPAALAAARAFAGDRSFDLVWHAGIEAGEVNRFHLWDRPWLYEGARALFGGDDEAFIRAYKFDVSPARDDRPFFGQFFKAALLGDIAALGRAGGALLLDAGYLIVAAALVQAAVVSVVLIVLPLWLVRRQAQARTGRGAVLLYFGAIGLAFLFVEIGYLQKLTLTLADPLLAAATVLSGFLVFAGLGSVHSEAVVSRVRAFGSRPVLAIAGLLAVLIAVEMLLLNLGPDVLLGRPGALRILGALVLIAPPAYLMGMLFPAGLSRVGDGAPALIPWAWAINGCASVISALLALLLSMHLGFTAVIGAGAILYLLAGLVFWRLPKRVTRP